MYACAMLMCNFAAHPLHHPTHRCVVVAAVQRQLVPKDGAAGVPRQVEVRVLQKMHEKDQIRRSMSSVGRSQLVPRDNVPLQVEV